MSFWGAYHDRMHPHSVPIGTPLYALPSPEPEFLLLCFLLGGSALHHVYQERCSTSSAHCNHNFTHRKKKSQRTYCCCPNDKQTHLNGRQAPSHDVDPSTYCGGPLWFRQVRTNKHGIRSNYPTSRKSHVLK